MLRSQGTIETKVLLQIFFYAMIPLLATQDFLPFHVWSLKTATDRKHPWKERSNILSFRKRNLR